MSGSISPPGSSSEELSEDPISSLFSQPHTSNKTLGSRTSEINSGTSSEIINRRESGAESMDTTTRRISELQLPERVFTCFPDLPLEIRQIIFQIAALETTQIVAVEFRRSNSLHEEFYRYKEARKEFRMILSEHHTPKCGEPKIYFNGNFGTLWCINFNFDDNEALFPEMVDGKSPKIRKLATGGEIWPWVLEKSVESPWKLMTTMKSLREAGVEEILIIMKPYHRSVTPWKDSNVEFRDVEEVDELNAGHEPTHWRLLRESLNVATLSIWNIEKAMADYIKTIREISVDKVRGMLIAGLSGEVIDDDTGGAYTSLVADKPWTVPRFRFVEAVNLGEEELVAIRNSADRMP